MFQESSHIPAALRSDVQQRWRVCSPPLPFSGSLLAGSSHIHAQARSPSSEGLRMSRRMNRTSCDATKCSRVSALQRRRNGCFRCLRLVFSQHEDRRLTERLDRRVSHPERSTLPQDVQAESFRPRFEMRMGTKPPICCFSVVILITGGHLQASLSEIT